jgi:hypothetical protein
MSAPGRRPWFPALVLLSLVAGTPEAQSGNATREKAAARDGQHDFDFLLGKWKYHLSRLEHPLTGSTHWVEFEGTGTCIPLWNGRAQLDQIEVDGPTGHIQGLTLRLYNPQSHQWSLHWANSKDGVMAAPTVGEFRDGRGEFYDQELFDGRMILVRYVWSDITSPSPRFEQSFSDDGGKTWEPNWITTQVRVPESPRSAPAAPR